MQCIVVVAGEVIILHRAALEMFKLWARYGLMVYGIIGSGIIGSGLIGSGLIGSGLIGSGLVIVFDSGSS